MKHERFKIWSVSLLAVLIFFSGIIRHDVDEIEYMKLAAEKQFDCVGKVLKDTTSSGSCVLISDRFVLSAAHVFIDSDTRTDTLNIDGNTVVSYVTYNQRVTEASKVWLEFNGKKVKVKNLWLHPAYRDSLTEGSCDIALLELDRPMIDFSPARINTAFNELNSEVVGVGYGASGPADRPDMVDVFNKKIAGQNVVDSIGGPKHLDYETLLICDFDHPTQKDINKTGSPVPRPLEYICAGGDSGGGLFRKNDNKWELIGICSGSSTDINQLIKTGYYGQIMEWTRVSPFSDWIEKQMK